MNTKQEYVRISLAAILDQAGQKITGKKGNKITHVEVAAVDEARDTVLYRVVYTPGDKS